MIRVTKEYIEQELNKPFEDFKKALSMRQDAESLSDLCEQFDELIENAKQQGYTLGYHDSRKDPLSFI